MSFSDEYNAGYTGQSWGVDTFSYSYQMGQRDRERQMREGTYGSGGGGGGAAFAGGGGIVFAALAVIIACCAFAIALISYPVAAGLAGIGFMIAATMINSDGAQMNGLGLVFALMVPIFIVYMFAFNLEKKAATFRPYRFFRQWWRILAGSFLVYTLASGLTMDPTEAGFFEYAIFFTASIAAPYLMYENSLRLDKKYDLEPIRFRWLEAIASPIKNRFVPAVKEDVRETPVFRVKDKYANAPIDVQIANGMAKFGDITVPVANIKSVSYERERGGLLIAAGIIVPVILIVLIGKANDEDFRSFSAQLFGLLSLGLGFLLVMWGCIAAMPPGRLQGPFRIVNFYFAKDDETNGQAYLAFARPKDERMFVQAIENGLKAMPRPEAPPALEGAPVKTVQEVGRFRKLVPFKF